MFKTLRSPFLTRSLVAHLTSAQQIPYGPEVCQMLDDGANPWAIAKPATADTPARSILYMIAQRVPEYRCMDAWFNRVGKIRGEPWQARGAPNPFHEWISDPPQPGVFMTRAMGRLFQAGLRPTAPEGHKLGPWLQSHCRLEFPEMLRQIARHCPDVLLQAENWEIQQTYNPVFARLLAHLGAEQMKKDTTVPMHGPVPKPRF